MQPRTIYRLTMYAAILAAAVALASCTAFQPLYSPTCPVYRGATHR